MGETWTITTPNAIMTLHFPGNTPEVQAERMKAIEKAAVKVMLANWRAEALKKQKEAEKALNTQETG